MRAGGVLSSTASSANVARERWTCARASHQVSGLRRERREGREFELFAYAPATPVLGEHKPARAGAEENVWPAVVGVVRGGRCALCAALSMITRPLAASGTNTPKSDMHAFTARPRSP